MFHFNLLLLAGALIVVTYLPLIFILTVKGESKTAKYFLLHSICVLIWGVGLIFIICITEDQLKKIAWIFAYSGVIFLPIFFYHAVVTVTQYNRKILLFILYCIGIYLMYLNLTGQLLTSFKYIFNSYYYPSINNLTLSRTIFYIFVISLAHIELIFYYKFGPNPNNMQTRLLILATPLGFLGGLTNFLSVYNINIYPFGNFLIPIYAILATYAIFKHHSFGIEIALKQSIIYYLLISSLSLLYLMLVFTTESLLQNIFHYQSLMIKIIYAFVVGMLLIPIKQFLQSFIEKSLFKGTTEQITYQNKLLQQEIQKVDKYKTLATLSSGIAHEIKNPLTTIKTFTEYLPGKVHDKEFLNKYSKLVGAEVGRIDEMVHQLLDYAKPSPPTFTSVSIYKLINDTLNFLNSSFVKYNIQFIKQFNTNIKLTLLLDEKQIRQALLNILLNSLEAMPHGGHLTLSTEQTENLFLLSVKDTGHGIPDKDIAHIFDPFFSLKDKGSGLGLSITKAIIESHGGKIYARSKEGHGTEMIIELPLKSSPGPEAQKEPGPELG